MEIITKYITEDDFNQYFGKNLSLELQSTNPSDTANAFLKRIEDRLETFINCCLNKNINQIYPEFSDYQKLCYQKALLEQAIWVFKNGDTAVDNGYDFDRGEIASNETLIKKILAPMCIMNLVNCGLWTTKLTGTRYGGLFRGII